MTEDSLLGKVALVTGASRGIGRAIARDLAAAGACVVGVARPSADLDAMAGELLAAHSAGSVVSADLRDSADVDELFRAIDRQYGRIDILINNAGVARVEPFAETTFQKWREVLATNLDAVFQVTQPAVERMRARRRGHLVFIASDAAVRGIAQMAAYCASKHAVLGFARALGEELSVSGIRITTVMPGPVNTTILRDKADRHDLLQPEDIAATVRQVLTMPARAEVKEILLVPRQQG